MIDVCIRVKSPQQWSVKAAQLGLTEENADGETVWKAGVNVDEIATVWVVAPTFDENGDQLTPGTKAQGQHINLRIDNPELEAELDLWQRDGNGDVMRDQNGHRIVEGSSLAPANKSERAWKWQGIEVLDMETVATPQRIWL